MFTSSLPYGILDYLMEKKKPTKKFYTVKSNKALEAAIQHVIDNPHIKLACIDMDYSDEDKKSKKKSKV